MTKPTIADDIAALSAAIDAETTPGPWNTAEYTDHDGPPCCDDIAVQASSPRDAFCLETLLTMDWSENPPRVAAFTREEAMATAAYIAAASPDRIARLIAALQEAREDSGRLNWFSDHVVSVVDDCRMLKTWHVESSVGYFRGETIRSAIDAARNASKAAP